MDHMKVLKRAWETVWRYRALWIFGIILALTTAGGLTPPGDGGGGGGGNGRVEPGGEDFLVARFVSETALIRMVDDHEETGEQHSVRQGFRIGWSRTAWRMFLINLVVGLPTTLAFILLFLLALVPLLLWITGSTPAGVVGTVGSIGLFFAVLFLAIVVGTALSVLLHFFRRACALEQLGVLESIRAGFGLVRRHLVDVGVMWLIMAGLRIALMILAIPIFILLLPATILLIIVGGVVGGIPALLVGGIASLFLEGAVPWILAAVIGIPIFALVLGVPWMFLGGLVEVFRSSVWTLTYRELHALEGLEADVEIEPTPA
jgi:hypothetical protein